MSYTRRALWAAGGVIGTAAAVDYFPNVGLFFLAPVAKVKSGAKITCDEVRNPSDPSPLSLLSFCTRISVQTRALRIAGNLRCSELVAGRAVNTDTLPMC